MLKKDASESLSNQRKCPECRQEISKAIVVKYRHYTNLLGQTKIHKQKMDLMQSQANLLPQYRETIKFLSFFDNRNNKEYYYFLRQAAEDMIEQNKYIVAKTILKQLIQFYPKYVERNFIGIGSKEQERGFCDECNISWYKNRIKQELLSAEDLLFFVFLRAYDQHEQRQWFEQTLASQPENFKIFYGFALIQHNVQNYQKALSLYQSVIQLSPTFSKPFQMISFIHKKQNNHILARKFAHLSLSSIFALYIISVLQRNVQELYKIMKKQTTYVRALNNIGTELVKQNQYEKAQKIFEECSKQNKLYIKSFINLAFTFI